MIGEDDFALPGDAGELVGDAAGLGADFEGGVGHFHEGEGAALEFLFGLLEFLDGAVEAVDGGELLAAGVVGLVEAGGDGGALGGDGGLLFIVDGPGLGELGVEGGFFFREGGGDVEEGGLCLLEVLDLLYMGVDVIAVELGLLPAEEAELGLGHIEVAADAEALHPQPCDAEAGGEVTEAFCEKNHGNISWRRFGISQVRRGFGAGFRESAS